MVVGKCLQYRQIEYLKFIKKRAIISQYDKYRIKRLSRKECIPECSAR